MSLVQGTDRLVVAANRLPVTLDLLLNHVAGVPSDLSTDGLWGRLGERHGTPRHQRLELLDGVLRHPPVSSPGTKFLYANAGIAIAGVLAEQATDTDWEALITKRLFTPLGMTSAGFGAPGTPGSRNLRVVDQPRGHGKDGKGIEPGPAADNPPAIGPAGTVHCSIGDWAKYVSLHLEGPHGRSPLLSAGSFERLHTPLHGIESQYAFGWGVTERPWGGGTVLTHSGSNTAWFCVVWLAPARDFGVLVCTNEAGEAAPKACDEAAAALIQDHLAHLSK